MSQLYFSCNQLQKSIADVLSEKWYLLHGNDRHLLVSFSARLDKGDMAVRPMNLFTIRPANLLGVTSVILNYVIVLIQSINQSE